MELQEQIPDKKNKKYKRRNLLLNNKQRKLAVMHALLNFCPLFYIVLDHKQQIIHSQGEL